ncbi:MAG: lysophospholipid acyltransferase family protein [Acidobacteriota bacterium]
MRKRGKTRNLIEYLAARLGCALLTRCSLQLASGVSRTVAGPVLYAVLRRARRRGRVSLDLAFRSSLNKKEKRQILLRMFQHLAQNAAEFVWYSTPASPPPSFVTDEASRRVVEEVNRTGTPVVFVTAHLGNWELLGLTGGGFSLRLNTVARPLDNARLNRWVNSRRELGPQRMCPTNGAPAVLAKALRRGEAAVLLADQNQRKHAVFVSFFGRPAATTPTPALLSLRTGAPVIAACLVRDSSPQVFRLCVAPPLYPRPDEPIDAEVRRITQAFTETLEQWIRRYPDQWLWPHRRWRTQP